eukprot:snap_masked-scaffold_46-processed-gene-1.29-mRNA-1 protein AED:1.00 eAED:1.00 QI:0/-1/0/0/-1/1/1/0/65
MGWKDCGAIKTEFLCLLILLWMIGGANHKLGKTTRYDKVSNSSVTDFGIREARPKFMGLWTVQRH